VYAQCRTNYWVNDFLSVIDWLSTRYLRFSIYCLKEYLSSSLLCMHLLFDKSLSKVELWLPGPVYQVLEELEQICRLFYRGRAKRTPKSGFCSYFFTQGWMLR
jgi:hypothetical protein